MIALKLCISSLILFAFFLIVAALDDAEKKRSRARGEHSEGVIPEEWEPWCGLGCVVTFVLAFLFAIISVWTL